MKKAFLRFVAGFLAFQMVIFSPGSLAFGDELTVLHGSENNWETFNVGAGQSTTITVVDADGNAMVDGRAIIHVLQDYATQIGGNLDILGIIAILNANGFNITETANINVVGGLILSTLGISEQDFFSGMAALNQASNDPGFIHNAGNINIDPGSFLALIAGAIKNTGAIAAEGGTAILAAGKEGYLSIGGDGLVNVQITEAVDAEVYDFQGNKIADQIDNSGTMTANGGFVKLTARGAEEVFDNVINHSGLIEAQSVSEKNGKIILEGGDEGIVRVSGDIDVSGKDGNEKGGTVHVLGDKVGLFDDAKIDASGNKGGGTVLVGGDYKGGNPLIQNAEAAYVGKDVLINASAINSGNGGKVIVWGTDSSKAYGSFFVTGGALSGDGGFIETSGHYLDVAGIRVDTSAANGKSGMWLLDPYNLTISSGADNNVTGATPFEPSGASSVLNAATLQMALDNGDVTIETGNDAGAGNGDITVSADLTSGNILSITAYGNVILNNDMTFDGDIIIQSQHGNITQNSGNLTGIGGAAFIANEGDISLTSAGNDLTRGDFSAINATITDTNGIDFGETQITNDFSLTTTGAVTQSSFLIVGGTATLAAGSGNNITLNNTSNNFSTVGITSGNNVALTDTNAIILNASTVGGTLAVTGTTIQLNGNIQTDAAVTLTGNVVLGTSVTIDTDSDNTGAGGAVTITGAVSGNALDRDLAIATNSNGGNGVVSLNTFGNAGGNYVNNVTVTTGGAATTLNGNILLDDSGSGSAASLTVNGSGNVIISDNVTIDTEQGNTNGVAGGAVNFGSSTVSADANGYTLTINTGNSDAGETGGAVTFGVVANTGGNYFTGGFIVNSDAATDGVITLNGNITTDGGAVSLTGDVRLPASRTIDTEVGGGNAGGAITFAGTLSATAGGVDLNVSGNVAGSFAGASLSFDTLNNAGGFYLNDVSMDLDGIPDGVLTLNGDIFLDNNGADAASFYLAGSGNVVVSNTLTIDTEQGNSNGAAGGLIDFYISTISADAAGYTLTINTGNSDAGETGGYMTFGNVTNTAGFYLSGLTLNSDAATDGVITPTNINIDGGTLSITGDLRTNSRTFDTEQGNDGAGGAVTLAGTVSATGAGQSLTINTATTSASANGGAVSLGVFNSAGGSSLATLGITTTGGSGGVGGAITQTGALTVSGTTTVASGSSANVVLNNAGNNFGTFTITSGNNVSLRDAGAIDLGVGNVSGTLDVTTNGAITQSGNLGVTGTTTLAAGSGNNITLSNAFNNFSTVSVTSGNNVSLRDGGNMDLGASTVSGTLSVTSGALTQSGALAVTGTTTVNAGANDITLNNAANNFGNQNMTLTGDDITIRDNNGTGLRLGVVTASGDINMTATEYIAVVSGATRFSTSKASGDINLTGAQVYIDAVISGTGANSIDVTLTGDDLVYQWGPTSRQIETNGGSVTFSSGGDVYLATWVGQNNFGTLGGTAAGDITVSNYSGGDLTLNSITGDSISIDTYGALTIPGSIDASETLYLKGVGITASGAITAIDTTTFNADAAHDLAAANAANNFGVLSINAGRNITLNDMNDLDIGSITANGTVALTAGGNITNSAGTATDITAGGNTSLTSGGYVGVSGDQLRVAITGDLTVSADGISGGNSAVLTGTANSFIVGGVHPGMMLFNGIDETPEPAVATADSAQQEIAEIINQEMANAMPEESHDDSKKEVSVDFGGVNFESTFDMAEAIDTSGLDNLTGDALKIVTQLGSVRDSTQKEEALKKLTSNTPGSAANAANAGAVNNIATRLSSSSDNSHLLA